MRALLGGVIGAVASASVWKAAEHFQQANYGWLVCFIGLVTGYCVHQAGKAGAGTGGGFARGALAVVLTLAAIVGGSKVYAEIMQATSAPVGAVSADSLQGGANVADAADKNANSGDSTFDMSTLEEDALVLGQSDYSKSTLQKNISDWDMIWMGIAALAAYVTGKGGESVAAVVATEQPREEAADQQSDEAEKEEA